MSFKRNQQQDQRRNKQPFYDKEDNRLQQNPNQVSPQPRDFNGYKETRRGDNQSYNKKFDNPQKQNGRNNRSKDRQRNKCPQYTQEQIVQGLKQKSLFKCEDFKKKIKIIAHDSNGALHNQTVIFELHGENPFSNKKTSTSDAEISDKNSKKNCKGSDQSKQSDNEVNTQTEDQNLELQQNNKSNIQNESIEEGEVADKEDFNEEEEEQSQREKNNSGNKFIEDILNKVYTQDKGSEQEDDEKQEEEEGQDSDSQQSSISQLSQYDEYDKEEDDKTYKGRVVQVSEDPYKRKTIVGKLIQQRQGNYTRKPKLYFQPIEKRLPKMLLDKLTENLQENIQKTQGFGLLDKYFNAKILRWDAHQQQHYVEIQDIIGNMGDIEVECKALLVENEVNQDDFSDECFKYLEEKFKPHLDEKGEYIIPQEERAKRLDLTNEIICTIDPATARDLDDALSITKLSNGNYKVGVHIADVGYFVEQGTILDQEARLRTTSVYLPHRVIPMLPRLLCESLCSLNPGVERLTFSCFFEMTEDGDVLEETATFAKSIIKSCAKFSYDVVQEMIKGKITKIEDLPEEFKPQNVDNGSLFEAIMTLQTIGLKRRNKRMENVPFQIERPKLRFQTNENSFPISYSSEVRYEANFVVEEFMLLANKLVGQKLVDSCQEIAVLRQHNYPKDEKILYFDKILQQMGDLNFKYSSSLEIKKSFDEVMSNQTLRQEYRDIINFRMIKILEQARYFVVQDTPREKWSHFALNFDVYTHFTSPIRRYPDILVHRLLFLAISDLENMKEKTDQKEMVSIMDLCNQCKVASRRIQQGCERIFMCLYLKNKVTFTKAIVMNIGSSFITLIVPEFNIEKDIRYDKYRSIQNTQIVNNEFLVITCQTKDKQQRQLTIMKFQSIDIKLSATNQFPIDFYIDLCIKNSESDQLIPLQ